MKWFIRLMIVIFAICFALFIKENLFALSKINGDSMLPALKEGNILLVEKIKEPNKGDIIVLKDNKRLIVKRLVGEEEDVIETKEREFYINGVKDERYLMWDDYREKSYEVEKDELFVLGDNINHSTDSREREYFKEDYYGRAILIIDGFKIKTVK